jgi:uridine phosphorylase
MKERLYHIKLDNSQKARYAILPGDPGRVESIAAFLEKPQKVAANREFVTFSGNLCGQRVFVTSTGIGGPSAAIALEELTQLGVDTFIRVGTCGGMQMQVQSGDLIIPTGAIRMEGTSKEYLPVEFPAVPNFGVTSALVSAAAQKGRRFHTGVVQSKDSFYGQHEPGRMPVGAELEYKWRAWIGGGALASEMECAALFCVAACLKVRAGAVLACVWNQERALAGLENTETLNTNGAISTAVEALRAIIAADADAVKAK